VINIDGSLVAKNVKSKIISSKKCFKRG